MNSSVLFLIYELFIVIVIIYFVVLGCFMITQNYNNISNQSELTSKLRISRTIGVVMFVWAFAIYIYLPPLLISHGSLPPTNYMPPPIYKILFLLTLMFLMPTMFVIIFTVLQEKFNLFRLVAFISVPYFILLIWQMIAPLDDIAFCMIIAITFAINLFLPVRFNSKCRDYVRRIKSVYSDISRREISWVWFCLYSFDIQIVFYVLHQMFWSPVLEIIYMVLSILNATYLCYFVHKQRAIDLDIELVPESNVEPTERKDRKGLYEVIEQKLAIICEEKRLFLNPDITLETLAHNLSINRTYLGMYFSNRGLTFYSYINTLRIEHAYKLMQENPSMSIREVCEQSAFRSQTTFRKVFKEAKGCLPSEVQRQTIMNNHQVKET